MVVASFQKIITINTTVRLQIIIVKFLKLARNIPINFRHKKLLATLRKWGPAYKKHRGIQYKPDNTKKQASKMLY